MRGSQKTEEDDLDQASTLMSLFNHHRNAENSDFKQNAIDTNSKEMLKVNNVTVEHEATSAKPDLKLLSNDSLSFGALFSYLFEN